MKKAKHRSRPSRSRLRLVDLLDEAGDSCDTMAALAQLLGHDPSETTNRIGVLLYREAGRLRDSLHELERHTGRK